MVFLVSEWLYYLEKMVAAAATTEAELQTGISNINVRLKNAENILNMVQAATFEQRCTHNPFCDKDCATAFALILTKEQHKILLDFLEKARDAKNEVEDLV